MNNNKFISFCIIITITIFLIISAEFFSFFIFEFYKNRAENKFAHQDFNISNIDNFSEIIKDDQQILLDYAPYIGFQTRNINSSYVNVKENKRVTINPCESDNSIEIWFFGGSAAFGSFVQDKDTIPSIISKKLCDLNYSVNIINYGHIGYTNTQEMIKYILELRDGRKPHIAIFYTGYNDIFSANQNLKAGLPQNEFKRQLEFNSWEKNNLSQIIFNTYLMKIINKLLGKQNPFVGWLVVAPESEKDRLINEITQVYENNFRFIKSISQTKGITTYFFFQPSIYTKRKLSNKEQEYYNLYKNNLNIEQNNISNKIVRTLNTSYFVSMTNIYDKINTTTYLDSVHKNKDGNEIEAGFIVDMIKPELEKYKVKS